ncbi:MAG TPA: branched-chain amino acid ABC transporter permease [Bradyrhizobium sp.]|nr:branched-chain amino acid ABC transporter permease [Bradyrhizobium sp.]
MAKEEVASLGIATPRMAGVGITREQLASLGITGGLFVFALVCAMIGQTYLVTLAARVAILALAVAGLNLAVGFAGLTSFGHAAYLGIGAYVAGVFLLHASDGTPVITWPVEIAATRNTAVIWFAAMVIAGLVALLAGFISLRTSGFYFMMFTLAFAEMLFYLAISLKAYGGADGFSIPLRWSLFGLNASSPLVIFIVAFALLLLTILFLRMLRASRFGLVLEAARQNEVRVAAVGVDVFPLRLVAFVISAMITALAGALYADLNRFVGPSLLSWQMSGELIIILILGGSGRIVGPVAGAAFYVLMEFVLGFYFDRWQFFLGVIVLIGVLFARGGIMGFLAGKARYG